MKRWIAGAMALLFVSFLSHAPSAQAAGASSPASCCKVCTKSKACGNGCIAPGKVCRTPPGCACDAAPAGKSGRNDPAPRKR